MRHEETYRGIHMSLELSNPVTGTVDGKAIDTYEQHFFSVEQALEEIRYAIDVYRDQQRSLADAWVVTVGGV